MCSTKLKVTPRRHGRCTHTRTDKNNNHVLILENVWHWFLLIPLIGSRLLSYWQVLDYNPLTHIVYYSLASASASIRACVSQQAAFSSSLGTRLHWHHNSRRFSAPNVELTARISPVGFHSTKESCQRPWQYVTSPSATAVMFRLPTNTLFFFLIQACLGSSRSRRLSPGAF